MNGQTLVERVREQKRTELDRLASDKTLIAMTGATLEADVVLGVVAESERAIGELCDEWAQRTDGEAAAETFRAAADTAGENADRLADATDEERDTDPLATPAEFETTIEAVAGGLVGQSLVLDGLCLQSVNFFVNEADEQRADAIRDVRTAVNGRLKDGAERLTGLCETDEDWTRAETAANDAVEAAYAEYVDRLGTMGIDPKPVC